MAGTSECPSFDEATRRFQEFLSGNDWPTQIVWVSADQHVESLQVAQARLEFDFARNRGLGVCLRAIRVTGGSTIAAVEYPRDDDEAERLMYPSDGGLKLSLVMRGDAR